MNNEMNEDDPCGDEEEETESVDGSFVVALDSIKTGRLNDEDPQVVVDWMGPATEEELNEHKLPQVQHKSWFQFSSLLTFPITQAQHTTAA